MPTITVEGKGSFQVPAGKRLVNALEDECGTDQLHACGGVARCTTCRVEFVAGEPAAMTQAEKDVLAAKGVTTPGVVTPFAASTSFSACVIAAGSPATNSTRQVVQRATPPQACS